MNDTYLYNTLVGFGPNTKITTLNDGDKLCKDLKLNDIFIDSSYIIGILKFKNNGKIYNFNDGIYVHENFKFNNIKIKNNSKAKKTTHSPNIIYNFITNTGKMNIRNVIFDDFAVSTNCFYNFTINNIKLAFLNRNVDNLSNFEYLTHSCNCKYLANGFSENTMVSVSAFMEKRMGDIRIDDTVNDDDLVIGEIKLDPYAFTFYKYNNCLVSNNTKIFINGIWKPIESVTSKRMPPQWSLINIITEKGLLLCNKEIFMDFLEVRNEFISDRINEIKNAAKYSR